MNVPYLKLTDKVYAKAIADTGKPVVLVRPPLQGEVKKGNKSAGSAKVMPMPSALPQFMATLMPEKKSDPGAVVGTKVEAPSEPESKKRRMDKKTLFTHITKPALLFAPQKEKSIGK